MPIAKVGDINIEYYVEGEGPPLLLIMGWIGHAGFWGEPFLERLRPHFQVIRLSNRGTGRTDKPPGEITIRMMADDAAGLLRELAVPQAHVLGVSMGGMIAQELVLNHPQAVQGLVLGCTNCGFGRGPQASPQVTIALGQSNAATTPRDRTKQFLLVASTPEFVQQHEAGLLDWVMETFMDAPTPLDVIGRHFGAITQFDTYERLPQVKAPTLILHGDRDQLVPVGNAEIIHERIAGSRVRIIHDAGHMFFWEKPEEGADAAVEFLASVAATA
jgi:pimeloyl-ACP methyl ester carboxylesterase